VNSQNRRSSTRKCHPNLLFQGQTSSTPAEKGALQELNQREDIVIKPADKGHAIVAMDKVDYLEEANRQLLFDGILQQTNQYVGKLPLIVYLSVFCIQVNTAHDLYTTFKAEWRI
jgi:hypothetical protein